MALGILYDDRRETAAYYDTVTGAAFGKVFDGIDAREQAIHFAIWLERQDGFSDDPRAIPYDELERARGLWREEYVTEDGMLSDTGHEELP